MRKVLFAGCLALVVALVAAGPAVAGTTFSDIKVTAACTLNGPILNVDVGFIYSDLLRPKPKAVPGVPPVFVHETITLEKHVPEQKEWETIATLFNQQLENTSDPVDVEVDLCSKERYNPDPGMDFSFPGGFQNANALRVVVTLDVANSNPMSNPFTARCISFPPPSCL